VSTIFSGVMHMPPMAAGNVPVVLSGQTDDFSTVDVELDFAGGEGSQWVPVMA
jgi:hypothetical protein